MKVVLIMLNNFIQLFNFVWNHPLNRNNRLAAVGRVIRWQLASRLMPGPIALPFVNGTYLFATRGMTGATGNWYCGLHEYEDMSFVLHVLRPLDLFVDVGANIGSYSILAGGGAGANVLAFEPIPSTFSWLQKNIVLNALDERVNVMNLGLADLNGSISFSSDQDTVNHVLSEGERANSVEHVKVARLDDVLHGKNPIMIKIDVEGYESQVLAGAEATLANPALLAVIVELNGSGKRYGKDDGEIHDLLLSKGFDSFHYEALNRRLISLQGKQNSGSNTIYLRNREEIERRIAS